MTHLEGMGEKITDNLKTSKLLCIGNEDERAFAISKVKDETYTQLRDRLKDMSYLDSRHTATSRGGTGGQLAMGASSSANSSKGKTCHYCNKINHIQSECRQKEMYLPSGKGGKSHGGGGRGVNGRGAGRGGGKGAGGGTKPGNCNKCNKPGH